MLCFFFIFALNKCLRKDYKDAELKNFLPQCALKDKKLKRNKNYLYILKKLNKEYD